MKPIPTKIIANEIQNGISHQLLHWWLMP